MNLLVSSFIFFCVFNSFLIYGNSYQYHHFPHHHRTSTYNLLNSNGFELEPSSSSDHDDSLMKRRSIPHNDEKLQLQQQRMDALKLPPCQMGYFQCTASDYCVKQQYNCDDIDDCPDGSDEHNCTDSTKALYYNKMFSKRPDEDREKMTNNCSLAGSRLLTPFCSCSLYNLFCVRKNLTKIPESFPMDTNEIDLSGNPVEYIFNHSFSKRLRNLKSLIMTKCEIHTIASDAFVNLTELTYLNLIGNNISRLDDHTFRRNYQLKILYLSHNPIRSINKETFIGLSSLVELDLRYCALTVLEFDTFEVLDNLEILWLQSNNISSIHPDTFINLKQLDTLSLAYNELTFIKDDVFVDLGNLKSFSLAYNLIEHIPDNNFEDLVSLTKLDLSHNRIKGMKKNALKNLSNLKSLDLRHNNFKKLPTTIFNELGQLAHIYFDDFKMCSYAQNVRVCLPRGDGISSVQHLLDNIILRVCVWIVALIACFGNVFVLIGRMLMQELNAVHSFFIKNLAMADFLMGVYLFIIAYHDLRFRNEYIRHEEQWRSSWQCHFSGVISTVSSESSVFILAVITADRYFSVLYPFSMKRRTMNFAFLAMFMVWSASIILAIIPLLAKNLFGNEFYGSNGVCLALQIHETFSMGWEYSTFIFCGLNSIAFIFIAYAYIKMSMTIMSSAIGLRTTQQQQDRNIAKRCGFIVATDCMCWLPIVIIKLLALSGVPINNNLYAWVAIFLLPVNSALNPVLYTLTTKLFKQHLNRIISHNFSSTHRQASNAGENSSSSFCSINLNQSHNGHQHQHHYQSGNTSGHNLNKTTITSCSQNSIYRKFNCKFLMTIFNEPKSDYGNNNQANNNKINKSNNNCNSDKTMNGKSIGQSNRHNNHIHNQTTSFCQPGLAIYETVNNRDREDDQRDDDQVADNKININNTVPINEQDRDNNSINNKTIITNGNSTQPHQTAVPIANSNSFNSNNINKELITT